ncbi:MAG TPA: serine hydrolase domain-containing protein [Ilumatobacter sp.]|nr:serine hydrolase domain-containing protein [Ilumatobacter sp.]
MQALELVSEWPVEHVAAAVVRRGDPPIVRTNGDAGRSFALASLTKPLTAWAIMVGVEEGIVALDEPIDRPDVQAGATLRHLLSHAAGFGFTGDAPVSAVGRRRNYSNTGIERAADLLAAAADIPFADYLTEAVFTPLDMGDTVLSGSPAFGARSTVNDMVKFVAELLAPRLIAPATRADVITPQYPDLAGIVPEVGRFDPCPWGLGVEILGAKSPHWMGRANSPQSFGHFGGSGTMMWVDPVVEVGVVALTDRRFDEWSPDALRLWPEFSDAVLEEVGRLA